MTKKIIFSVFVFIGAFIIGILIFMPFGGIASKYVDEAIAKNNINLQYDKLDVGLFSAKMTNIRSGDFLVDKLTLGYNPLGLIFKRISFNAESPFFIAKGKMAGNEITADIKGSINSVAQLFKYSGSGSVDIKGNYNLSTKQGNIDLSSGAATFAHPMMNVEVDSLSGKLAISGAVVTIDNLMAKGKTSLDSRGKVVINPGRVEYSALDIEGKAGMMGMDMNFKLQGAVASPRLITN